MFSNQRDLQNRLKFERPSKARLFAIVTAANLTSMAVGVSIAWTSPMMPKFKHQYEDSPFDYKISKNEEGWIFALISVGAGISAFIAGPVADRFGRLKALFVATIMFALACILKAIATPIGVLYAARTIEGFGAGFTMTVLPIYVGEISTNESRGAAGSLIMLFMTGVLFLLFFLLPKFQSLFVFSVPPCKAGMLYSYCMGPYTKYVIFQLSCLIVPVLAGTALIFIPESPFYLIKRGLMEEAAMALQRVRGTSLETIVIELPMIQLIVYDREHSDKGTCADIFYSRRNRRAMITVIGLMAFKQLSGAIIIVINSESIFMQASSSLDAAISTIIVGSLHLISSIAVQFVLDKWKRRTLLKLSAGGMAIMQCIMGTYFYFNKTGDIDILGVRWIPVIVLIVFQLFFRLGLGPLPFAILGEVMPQNIKAIAASAVTATFWSSGFILTFFYPEMDSLGTHYLFWTFSIFCICAFIFVHFLVIETRAMSLGEIQEILQQLKLAK